MILNQTKLINFLHPTVFHIYHFGDRKITDSFLTIYIWTVKTTKRSNNDQCSWDDEYFINLTISPLYTFFPHRISSKAVRKFIKSISSRNQSFISILIFYYVQFFSVIFVPFKKFGKPTYCKDDLNSSSTYCICFHISFIYATDNPTLVDHSNKSSPNELTPIYPKKTSIVRRKKSNTTAFV